MSVGRNFVRAAIAHNQPGQLRQVTEDFFVENEVPLFQFVRQHFEAHGTLPDGSTLAAEGYQFGESIPNQPMSYFEDRLRRRYQFNQINERFDGLTSSLQGRDMDGAVQVLQEMLGVVNAASPTASVSELGSVMSEVLEDYEYAKLHPGLRGITMGWDTLNNATLGAVPADLVVIAARPGQGKTMVLLKMARSAALDGKRVLFMSMEMPKLQIARRWLGQETGINPNFIRAGQLSTWAEPMLYNAVNELPYADNVFLESGNFNRSVSAIEAMILQKSPEVVYVDAAYLLSAEGSRKGYLSRWESISEVVRELKAMAMRYNIPIFITVQFNRNQKNNSTKELDLGDIAGADSIPQDASIVLGLRKGYKPNQDITRIIEMMKNREGEVCSMAINYRFSPVNMDEIPLVMPDGEDNNTESNFDGSFME